MCRAMFYSYETENKEASTKSRTSYIFMYEPAMLLLFFGYGGDMG